MMFICYPAVYYSDYNIAVQRNIVIMFIIKSVISFAKVRYLKCNSSVSSNDTILTN